MVKEIWVCDFEFSVPDGGKPHPVCFCAEELHSGRKIRMWLDGIDNPQPPIDFFDPTMIYVAYYSIAEMSCHAVLGWEMPENIIDLFCEWRVLTNSSIRQSNGLIDACQYFGIPTIDPAYKEKMRGRILAGAPYSEVEKPEILDYCQTDIIETKALYKVLYPTIENIERALFRGRYMAITAKIEDRGVPLDVDTFSFLSEHWELVKLQLLKKVKTEFNFFDGLTFRSKVFADYLYKNDMAWAMTEKGNLKLDEETWRDLVVTYPHLQPVREVRGLLGKFKKLNITCGTDGRNRGMLSPFATKTGRNAPKAQNIFTNPSWLRCLIKPHEGTAIGYLDYEQQEFNIAAVLSGDENMKLSYQSGDPYLQFAKMAGAIPPEGTKKTHKAIRDIYKQACLAIQYGMRAESLSTRINKPLAYAHELIRQHQRLYPRYWKWVNNVIAQSKLHKRVQTIFGWQMRVVQGTRKEDLTLGNFLMQSTGADILRVACYLLDEEGIKILTPVHDALLVEVDLETADEDIQRAEKIMQEASKIVLGSPLRTEAIVVKYPDRYIDERGRSTWEKVETILQGIRDGTIVFDETMLGSKIDRHIEKLKKRSHNNLTTWFQNAEKDNNDLGSLNDSTLSHTENFKNLKGMWRESL